MKSLLRIMDIQEMKECSEKKILEYLSRDSLNKKEIQELRQEFVVYQHFYL